MKNNKTKVKSKSSSETLISVEQRKSFYKDGSKTLKILAGISVINMVASSFMLYWANTQNTKNIYFAIKDDGTLVNMIPFSEPNLGDAVVSSWTEGALIDTFDLNFSNIQTRISSSAIKYFTSNGGSELISSLEDEGHFETIMSRQLIMQFIPEGAPIMIKKGLNQATGKYSWKLQQNGTLNYINQNGKQYNQKIVFSIMVERVSLRNNPKGIGIAKLIMTKR